MAKGKLATPAWILEGYDSPADYENSKKGKSSGSSKSAVKPSKEKKGSSKVGSSGTKTFKIKECPKCHSDDVGVVLSGSDDEEGGGDDWECRKCKWKGQEIVTKELTEDELMEYMDKRGEEVA